jgi:1,4-dihydroxy-2-naphthoate octaprenyltransferase
MIKDLVAVLGFSGIFLIESFTHMKNFDSEITQLVIPAFFGFMPYFIASILHAFLIVAQFTGSFLFILSFAGQSQRTFKTSTSLMFIVVAYMSWIFWINRGGVFFTCAGEAYMMRKIHIMKNAGMLASIYLFQRFITFPDNSNTEDSKPTSSLKQLFISTRPWSLPATVAPIAVCFFYSKSFPITTESHPNQFLNTLIWTLATTCLQSSTNLFNSLQDFTSGLDVKETAGDRTLVDGIISPIICKRLGLGFLGLFILLITQVEVIYPLLFKILVFLGVLLSISYSIGLKIHGLGDISVFLSFGPLLTFTTGLVLNSLSVAVKGTIICIPLTLFIVGILHANNIRDLENDQKKQVKTVAVYLGRVNSLRYLDILIFGGYLLQIFLSYFYLSNLWITLFTVLTIPKSIQLRSKMGGTQVPVDCDALYAQLMIAFAGSLCFGLFVGGF